MKRIKTLGVACLLSMAIEVRAEKLASQNWSIILNSQINETYTVNDSKSSFGVFCSGERCLFYLHQGLNCIPGTKYSVMVNSQSISTAISMECTQIRGNLFQILDPFETILTATQTGEVIGFAVALQSGDFAVNHFSLVGAKLATERVFLEAAKSKLHKQKPPLNNSPKPPTNNTLI